MNIWLHGACERCILYKVFIARRMFDWCHIVPIISITLIFWQNNFFYEFVCRFISLLLQQFKLWEEYDLARSNPIKGSTTQPTCGLPLNVNKSKSIEYFISSLNSITLIFPTLESYKDYITCKRDNALVTIFTWNYSNLGIGSLQVQVTFQATNLM